MTKQWLSVLVLLVGCEQWRAPEKIQALESRVDELSAEVSAMAGHPVGAPKKKEDGEHEGEEKEAKADEHGDKDEKDDKGGKDKGEKGKHDSDGDEHAHGRGKDRDKDKDEEKDGDKDKGEEHAAKEESAEEEEKPKEEPEEAPHEPPHWTYAGASGPAKWASMDPAWKACSGASQSPIDLELRATKAKPIKFDYKATPATVVDNGHTLQVNLEAGSTITLEGRKYDLVQFHVHTPSEHTIAGESYPMELHLVHKSEEGKLAVIGVMYEVGSDGKELEPVWAKWPAKKETPVKLKKPFDPATLLPDSRTVVQYTGSLTTPPCTEGVKWNVMRRTRTMSAKELDTLKTHYPKNARPVMPRGERILL